MADSGGGVGTFADKEGGGGAGTDNEGEDTVEPPLPITRGRGEQVLKSPTPASRDGCAVSPPFLSPNTDGGKTSIPSERSVAGFPIRAAHILRPRTLAHAAPPHFERATLEFRRDARLLMSKTTAGPRHFGARFWSTSL